MNPWKRFIFKTLYENHDPSHFLVPRLCVHRRGIKMENRTELGHDLGRPNECQRGFLDDIVSTFSKRAGLTLTVMRSTGRFVFLFPNSE